MLSGLGLGNSDLCKIKSLYVCRDRTLQRLFVPTSPSVWTSEQGKVEKKMGNCTAVSSAVKTNISLFLLSCYQDSCSPRDVVCILKTEEQ